MEESKKKILLVVGGLLLLLVVIGVVYFLFFYEKETKTNTSPQQNQEETDQGSMPDSQDRNEEISVDTTTTTPSFKEKSSFTEMDLKNLTTSFVERFGSYSNHSQFANLKDLRMFMTEDMQDWTKEYIEEQKQKKYSGNYYGIETRVISSNIQTFNKEAGEAEVVASTQRTESKEKESQENTFNQKIKVDLIKVNGEWKVNNAEWQ